MWRCTVRPKRNPCPGIAWQQGSVYVTIRDHTCGKNQHKKLNKKITGETKKRCRDNKFASARTIAEKLILNAVKDDSRAKIPLLRNVAHAGNMFRSKSRPKHPKDQFFKLDEENLPENFFQLVFQCN